MTPKVLSSILTVVFLAAVVAVLLSFGYNPPDPPIPEEGVEVNVGDSDFGLGDAPEPASSSPNNAPPASDKRVATQSSAPSLPMPSSPNSGNVTSPAASQQTQPESKEPELNPNATFPGMRNRNNKGSGSQGTSSGTGDQGKPDGTINSGNYSGNGGVDGNYNLKGRTAASLPKPDYNSNLQGKVVVSIWVNREGRVTRAEYEPKGSTTANGTLRAQAVAAARKARFSPSPSAPEEQKGTIEYIFKI